MAKRKKKVDEKAEAVVPEPIIWDISGGVFVSGHERAKDLMRRGAKVSTSPAIMIVPYTHGIRDVVIVEAIVDGCSVPSIAGALMRECGPLLTQLFDWAEDIEDDGE